MVGLAAIALINGAGRGSAARCPRRHVARDPGGAVVRLFFIVFHAGSPAGTAAFLSGRVGSVLAVLLAAAFLGASPIPRRGTWRLVAVVGVFDGSGSILYLYASQGGLLASPPSSRPSIPAFTVLCARLIAHERQTRTQTAGAVLAVAAVALIAGT